MPEAKPERPLSPTDRTRRLSDNEVVEMQHYFESLPTRKLQLLLTYFKEERPTPEEAAAAYEGTEQEGYPYEELMRVFDLNVALVQAVLSTRTDILDDLLPDRA